MPKILIDYSKCCIYKIEHIENESIVYVGHTTNFDKRKGDHKCSCRNKNNNKYNYKLYQMIRDNGGFDMFRMIEILKYPCNDKREAEKKENEVMKELKANMNTYKSFTTEEEKKEKEKQYREDNKETIEEKKNEYMKDYMKSKKDRKHEYDKKYREDNEEILTQKKKKSLVNVVVKLSNTI